MRGVSAGVSGLIGRESVGVGTRRGRESCAEKGGAKASACAASSEKILMRSVGRIG
jgi:hypothetical protein